jgi:hypothetical protein
MYYDVTAVKYVEDYRLEITFANGRSGVVDFRTYIEKGGVFAPLAEPEYFRGFSINRDLGVITWGNEVDLAPEVLYAEATGEPLPAWMETEAEIKQTA